jgi:hypothetical protein
MEETPRGCWRVFWSAETSQDQLDRPLSEVIGKVVLGVRSAHIMIAVVQL